MCVTPIALGLSAVRLGALVARFSTSVYCTSYLNHQGDYPMEQHQRKQEESTVADDPKAREMLRQAFEKTARWQKDFKGFTADLTVNVNGNETSTMSPRL